jgi:hypothetical protein
VQASLASVQRQGEATRVRNRVEVEQAWKIWPAS